MDAYEPRVPVLMSGFCGGCFGGSIILWYWLEVPTSRPPPTSKNGVLATCDSCGFKYTNAMLLIASRNVLSGLPSSVRDIIAIFISSLNPSYIGSRTFSMKPIPASDNPGSNAAIVRWSPVVPVAMIKDTMSWGTPLNSVGGGLYFDLYSLMCARYSSTFMVISTESPGAFSFSVVVGVCPDPCYEAVSMLFVSIEIQVNSLNPVLVWSLWDRD